MTPAPAAGFDEAVYVACVGPVGSGNGDSRLPPGGEVARPNEFEAFSDIGGHLDRVVGDIAVVCSSELCLPGAFNRS